LRNQINLAHMDKTADAKPCKQHEAEIDALKAQIADHQRRAAAVDAALFGAAANTFDPRVCTFELAWMRFQLTNDFDMFFNLLINHNLLINATHRQCMDVLSALVKSDMFSPQQPQYAYMVNTEPRAIQLLLQAAPSSFSTSFKSFRLRTNVLKQTMDRMALLSGMDE